MSLKEVVDYYASTRGVGHSDLLLNVVGAHLMNPRSTPVFVLCSNEASTQFMKRAAKEKFGNYPEHLVNFIPYRVFLHQYSKGLKAPIIWDNSALFEMLSYANTAVETAQNFASKSESELTRYETGVEKLLSQIKALSDGRSI